MTRSEKIKHIQSSTLHSGKITDMTDIPELTSIEQATPQELTEIITELEQYRERLVNDTLSMAQRAKVMKAQAIASLEPSLAEIDTTLETLRDRHATLISGN